MGDANFRLVREMNGKFDPEDVAFADGSAYFTKWALFKDYIDKDSDSKEVSTLILAIIFDVILILRLQKSTCNRLTVAIMQNITKFKIMMLVESLWWNAHITFCLSPLGWWTFKRVNCKLPNSPG
jgi:hypothetical protein